MNISDAKLETAYIMAYHDKGQSKLIRYIESEDVRVFSQLT